MSDTAPSAASASREPFSRRIRPRVHADFDSHLTWIAASLSLLGIGRRSRRAMQIGRAAAARMAEFENASETQLTDARLAAASALRGRAPAVTASIDALAVAGEAARRRLGLAPFVEQFACASALLSGAAAEMETGEGKTLGAFLAAAVFALAGRIVHVVTANDYLAERDAAALASAYASLGLSVGAIVGGAPYPARRGAYDRAVAYVSSKEVVFDFLRDNLIRAATPGNAELAFKIDRALGEPRNYSGAPLQRGLDVAIVDELDSVLIDEAGAPLLISSAEPADISEEAARQALALAETFSLGLDFALDPFDNMPRLTTRGIGKLERETAAWTGPWRVRLIRQELMRAAIAAQRVFERERRYLVRDGKIVLIDQQTGRPAPDRHWGHGIGLMIEMKEGCASSGRKKSLASVSFQRYFRTYSFLCGTSGTAREVSRELRAVYGLPTVRVPRRKPLSRWRDRPRVFARREDLWLAAATRVKTLQARGQPVLVAVRSVLEAGRASAVLTAAGIEHRVLSAAQDSVEAEIVGQAGARGAVTVVTNMAGRGTDIRLGPGVAKPGGLAVFVCERHDSRRVDRQLIGRCARQGDPGLVIEWCALEDSVLRVLSPIWTRLLAMFPELAHAAISRAQRITDARDLRGRVQLLRRDNLVARMLAFVGGVD